MKEPVNTDSAKSQPVRDKADNAENKAEILQPEANLAPSPIKNPPIAAPKNCLFPFIFLILNSEANKVAKAAPIIIPVLHTVPPLLKRGRTIALFNPGWAMK